MMTAVASSVELNWIERIKQKDSMIVDGYIKNCNRTIFEIDNASFYDNIPDVINILCLEYYHMTRDRFDPHFFKNLEITEENTQIATLDGDTYGDGAALLSNVVSTGSHLWKFKVLEHDKGNDMIYIGIFKNKYMQDAAEKGDKVVQRFVHAVYYVDRVDDQKTSYAVNFCMRQLRGNVDESKKNAIYCDEAEKGDIIGMNLDLNKHELSFSINDKSYGKADFEIEKTEYRAAVCLYAGQNGTGLKLMSYEILS